MNNIKDLLTIIIPCKNEENYIEKTLNNINNQINIKNTIVYIADAGSTDDTLNIINNFKNKEDNILNINVIVGGHVSVGRNNGLKLVDTEYVLFIDADTTLPNNNHIQYYLDYLINNDLHLMTSPIYCTVDDLEAELMYKSFNMINKVLSKVQPFAVGTFFITKTDVIRELGGFDETVIHSEDYLLSKKYDVKKFKIGELKIGQDNRRFKKFGYLNMIELILKGGINQNNIEYFRKDNNYWN